MRAPVLALLIALCAGCPAGVDRATSADEEGDDGAGNGSGGGLGGVSAECNDNTDCVAAGPKCCDCPTHAVPANDPAQQACVDVSQDCAPASCGSPMRAACELGQCVLECAPVACETACANGFVTDGNGCLTCECAGPTTSAECTGDSDCVRVREDCCGCEMGGNDTAVPTSQAAARDAALMCPANPSCPGFNSCSADLSARCVQGSCSLVDGPLPDNACGRADLPGCDAGEACYVNASDQATMHGVGICQP